MVSLYHVTYDNGFILPQGFWLNVQGDHSACSKPPADIDLKVAF